MPLTLSAGSDPLNTTHAKDASTSATIKHFVIIIVQMSFACLFVKKEKYFAKWKVFQFGLTGLFRYVTE